VPTAMLAFWSDCQKLNLISSVQFSSVTSLCTRLNRYGVSQLDDASDIKFRKPES